MIPYGSLVVYVTPKGRRYTKRLVEDPELAQQRRHYCI